MSIQQKRPLTAMRDSVSQFPNVEHPHRLQNPAGEKDCSMEDLLVAIENLQQVVSELLLKNQVLRTAVTLNGKNDPGSARLRFSEPAEVCLIEDQG